MPTSGGNKRVTATLDIQAQITNYQESLNKLQGALGKLHLPDGLRKGFENLFVDYQRELEKLSKSSANNKLSVLNEKEIEKSFDRIDGLYSNLIKKLHSSGYKDSILESDFKAIEQMKAAQEEYSKAVKGSAAELEKEQKALDKIKAKLEEQKKQQKSLGSQKGGAATSQKYAQKAVEDTNKAFQAQKKVVQDLTSQHKEQEKTIKSVTSEQKEALNAQANAERKLAAFREVNKGKTDDKTRERELNLIKEEEAATARVQKANEDLAAAKAQNLTIEKNLQKESAKQTDLEAKASEAKIRNTEATRKLTSITNSYNKKVEEVRQTEEQLGQQNKTVQEKQQAYESLVRDTLTKVVEGLKEVAQAAGIDVSQIKSIEDVNKALEDLTDEAKDRAAPAAKEVGQNVGEAGKLSADAKQKFLEASDGLHQLSERQKEVERLSQSVLRFFSIDNAVRLFKRAVRSAYETIKDLDAVMTETAVVTDFSVGDMWSQLPEYTKRANELGVSIHAVYEASTLYYQQGLKTNEVMAVTNATLRMARIAGLDAAEATDRVTNALRGFNMEINEANADRIADVYSKLAAISASNVDEISTAMTKVASLANSANMGFENTAAFLAQIIETTRESAETAGTALKTVIARFSEVKKLYSEGQLLGTDEEGEAIDVNKVSTALRTAGIDLNEFLTGAKGLDEVFVELASKWDSLDIVQQRYIATMAAGSRQQSRFIALMSDYQRTQELTAAAQNANGASMEQYEKTLDSLQSKLERLKNAWNEFTTGIVDSDFIKGAVDALTNLLGILNKITDSSDGTVKSIKRIGLAVGGLALGKSIFNKLLGSIGATFVDAGKKASSGFGQGFLDGIDKIKNGFSIFTKDFWIGMGGEANKNFEIVQNSLNNLATAEANLNVVRQQSGVTAETLKAAEDALAGAQLQNEAVLKSLSISESTYNTLRQSGLSIQEQAILLNGSEASQKALNLIATKGLEDAETKEAIAKALANKEGKKGIITRAAEILQLAATKLGIDLTTTATYKHIMAKKMENAALKENIALMAASLGPILLVVGALAAIVGVVLLLIALTDRSTIEDKIKSTEESLKQLKETTQKEKEELDNLVSSFEKLKDDYKVLETLTQGTEEWRKKIEETNDEVKDLVANFSEYGKYISLDPKTGLLVFDTEAAEEEGVFVEREKRVSAGVIGEQKLESNNAWSRYNKFVQDTAKGLSDEGIRFGGLPTLQRISQAYGEEYWNKESFDAYLKKQGLDNFNLDYENLLPSIAAINNAYNDYLNTVKASNNIIASEYVKMAKSEYEFKNGELTSEQEEVFNLVANSVSEYYEKFTDYENAQFRKYILDKYKDAEFKDDGIYSNDELMLSKEAALSEYSGYLSTNTASKQVESRYKEVTGIKDRNLRQQVVNLLGGIIDDSISGLTEEDFKTKLENEDISFSLRQILTTAFSDMQSRIETSRKNLRGKLFNITGGSRNLDTGETKFNGNFEYLEQHFDELSTSLLENFYKKISDFSDDQKKEIDKIAAGLDDKQLPEFLEEFSSTDFSNLDQSVQFLDTWKEALKDSDIDLQSFVSTLFQLSSTEPQAEKIIADLQEAWTLANSYKGKDEMSDEDFQKMSKVTGGLINDQFDFDVMSKIWRYKGEQALEQAIIEAAKSVANQKIAISGEDEIEQDRYNEVVNEASLGGYDTNDLKEKAKVLESTKKLSEETAIGVALINEKLNKGLENILDSYEDWNKLLDKNGKLKKDLGTEDLKIYGNLKDSLKEMLNIEGDLSDSFLEDNIEDIRALAKGGKEAEEALARLQAATGMDYLTQLRVDTSEVDGAEEAITSFENYVKDIDIPKLEVGAKWIGDSAESFIDRFNAMARAANLTTDQIRGYMKRLGYDVEVIEQPIYDTVWVGAQADTMTYREIDGAIVPVRENISGHFEKKYVGSFPVIKTITSAGTGGGGISYKNLGGAKDTDGSKGGGGSSKSDKPKNWKNPYDELYNLTEQINENSRQRNLLEAEYDLMLNDRTKANDVLLKNSYEQLKNLEKELALQKQLQAGRKSQLDDILNETYEDSEGNRKTFGELGVGKYAHYDEQSRTIVIDWEGLEALAAKAGSEEKGKAVEEYIKKLEDLVGQFEEVDSKVLEIEKEVQDIRMRGMDKVLELQERVREAFIQARQDEIDELQAVSDTIEESTSRVIDGIREQVEAERQARENEKAEEDIADKEMRLAYLQRDTSGANDLEILKLNEELADARQDYTDSLIDQGIEKMQEQAEKAQQQRQKQIDLMTSQLAWDQKSGAFNKAVEAILKDSLKNKEGTPLYEIDTALGTIKGWYTNEGFVTETGKVLETYKAKDGELKVRDPMGQWQNAHLKGIEQNETSLMQLLKKADGVESMTSEARWKWLSDLLKEIKEGTEGWANFKVKQAEDAGEVYYGKKGKGGHAKYDSETKRWIADDGTIYTKLIYENGMYKLSGKYVEEEPKEEEKKGGPKIEVPQDNGTEGKPTKGTPSGGPTTEKTIKGYTYSYDGPDYGIIQAVQKANNGSGTIKTNNQAYLDSLIAKNTTGLKKTPYYKTGGLVDFTGPAWLDGTKTKPEIVLNQADSQNFIILKDILSQLLRNPIQSGSQGAGGDNYYEINIDAEIANDYDVDRLASRIKQQIYSDGMYRNVNTLNWQR